MIFGQIAHKLKQPLEWAGFGSKTLQQANSYGFMQTRLRKEVTNADSYGKATRYMALDCEMDQNTTGLTLQEIEEDHHRPGLVLKVSLVNQDGHIVLDTLVDYT